MSQVSTKEPLFHTVKREGVTFDTHNGGFVELGAL